MNAFAGIRPKGGRNPTPLAFFPGVCSGGYLFSSGGPTPANFYPGYHYDLRKFSFAHRIVNVWNSFPEIVYISRYDTFKMG